MQRAVIDVIGEIPKEEARLIMNAVYSGIVEGVSYAKTLVPEKRLAVTFTIKIDVSKGDK